jgi:RimJ/RimL family protein N-acetyltransferase
VRKRKKRKKKITKRVITFPLAMKLRKSSALAGFRPLHGSLIIGSKTRLREKKFSDVRNDYRWQSDPELSRLDAAPVLIMSFSLYLLDYAAALHQADFNRYPLGIDTLGGKHIGNCTCYDIDEKKGEAQLGIMIGNREYWDRGYGTDALNTMVDYIFRKTSLHRLYLKTLEWNLRAQKCFIKCGFTPCGQLRRNGYEFVLMELTREEWAKLRGGS